MQTVRVGYSPCPNDTFLFYALVHGLVDGEGYVFEPLLADVETLNELALAGELAMTKASYGVLAAVHDRYWCLRSGGALGRGCGPLVVCRRGVPLDEALHGRIAVPGVHTTANLLLDLWAGRAVDKIPMVFHEILPAVARGEVSAGVVIHEGRFTYGSHGLVALSDLGQWWEGETALPIPLGGILLRRDLPELDPIRIQRALRRSVEYALAFPEAASAYVRAHAQELDEAVVGAHIRLYVNEFSVDVGCEGQRAVEALLARAVEAGRVGRSGGALFPPLSSLHPLGAGPVIDPSADETT